MHKTIVVGIGGTGLDALRALRRRVVEEKGSLEALPNLGYFYIDTDPKEVAVTEDNRQKWEVLGTSIQLSSDEVFIVETPEISQIVSNIGAYPHIQSWFPIEQLRSIDQSSRDTPGARQVRPLGRCAFTLKSEAIGAKFQALFNRLPQASGGGESHVYVIGSLSGGTGSGMFLDLAYRIREWTSGVPKLHAFLVMPDLSAGRGDRYLANAYAALLELNYFNIGATSVRGESRQVAFRLPLRDRPVIGAPFDYCYLVGSRNERSVELNLSAVPDMIAHRIYLPFDSSFADEAATLLNNASFKRAEKLQDPFTGNVHSQNFFTFGLSSIRYPTQEVTEILGYSLGSDVLQSWLQHRVVPGNVSERVKAMLSDLKLSDDYLVGNKHFFEGKQDFESADREVDAFVNGIKAKMPAANRVSFINEQQRQCIEHFRSVGMLKFYQDKRDDLEGAVRAVQALMAQKVGAMLTDPELGFEFVEAALDELIQLLTVKHQQFIDAINGLPQKESASRRALTGYFNELEQAERKIIPGLKERAIKDAVAKVCEALKMNLTATIGIQAHDFGRAFLKRTLEQIKALSERVIDWRHGVERIQEQIQEELANRKAHLLQEDSHAKDFNGQVLFNEARLAILYDSLDRGSARRAIESSVVARDGVLDMPFRGDQAVDAIYRAGLQWLTSESRSRVSTRTVADKLLEDFPDHAVRRAKLAENFAKSAPFLMFDGGQQQMYAGMKGVAYENDPNATARLAAILDDAGGTLAPVMKVKRDLEAATGIPVASIKRIVDQDQILFLQETTGFPLRMIRDVAVLRDRYLEYIRDARALPLQIQASFDPPLPDLFLASEQDKQRISEAEEAFVAAWVDGRIRLEPNKREGVDEVRYRYFDLGSDTFVRLGAGWPEAFDFVLEGNNRDAERLRGRLTSDVGRLMRSLDSHVKRSDFAGRLTTHFSALRTAFEFADEDPQYLKFDAIRRRITEKYKLPVVTSTAAPPPPSPPSPSASELEERFSTLARTALRNGRGTLTPAMSNMLEASRSRLGLSLDRANELRTQVESALHEAPRVTEYREMFEAFFEDGEITDDERAILIERQVELKLAQNEVDEIEASVIGRNGLRV